MNLKEAYSALGLPETASKEEAKKSFKKLAMKHHPDKPGGDAELFKKINEAHQVIETGKDYGPTQQPQRNQSGFGGINIEDFIRQTSGGPFGRSQQKHFHVEDRMIDTEISFRESVIGCQKDLKYKRTVKCEPCDGSGQKTLGNGCTVCGGTGTQTRRQGNMIFQSTCESCGGMRKVEPCTTCHENGYVDSETSLTVNIPGGVKEGKNILRLQGVGDYAGSSFVGDQYASILLKVKIENSSSMNIEENDVITKCDISLLEALEGCKKQVDTIDGSQEIVIPPNLRNKDELILPKLGVNRQGNERIIISVSYPSNTASLIDALKQGDN